MLENDTQKKQLATLTAAQVYSVYSGKPGCACGCKGKYSYNSQHVAFASTNRGYAVLPEDVSDKEVNRILGKLQAAFREDANDERISVDDDGCWFAFNLSESRTYTVYVLPAPAVAEQATAYVELATR